MPRRAPTVEPTGTSTISAIPVAIALLSPWLDEVGGGILPKINTVVIPPIIAPIMLLKKMLAQLYTGNFTLLMMMPRNAQEEYYVTDYILL